MRRVLVIGPGGAGKSTFSARLGQILGIDVSHLDKIYWKAGWSKPTADEWQATIKQLISSDEWIIDGNYSGTLEQRVNACDTIIFLDLPRLLCLWRITKRRLMYRKQSRPDMAEGCTERLNLEFALWVWNYSRRTRPRVLRIIRENAERKRVEWLRTRGDVKRFLTSLAGMS